MATWTPISPIAVDMPGTAEWANLVQDNPIAIAEGASGAPKNTGISLGGIRLGGGMGTSSTSGTYTGLGRVRLIRFSLSFVGSATVQVRFTSDNGATWGAWRITTLSGATASDACMADATLDLQSGSFVFSGLNSGSAAAALYGANALVVPANANGFHIGLTDGFIMSHQAYIIGGRA